MDFPIYDLLINEDEGSDAEVSFIALVDSPAIKKSFLQFNDNFIDPNKGEKKDEFLNRCISYVINEGKENEQAVAICNSLWEQHFAEDSYTDYPKQASENAKAALRYAEKYGWNECGTPVGKARANQLANNEPISRDTIARMASFARHKENSNKELGDGCGRLMWLAWGGDAGVEWAATKLKQIDKFNSSKIAFAIQSESEHIITGPLMIPQQLIYRKSERFGEHYVKFSVDTIKQIAIKFSKKGYQKNVNLMHEADMQVEGLTMFESFISDTKRGIKPMEAFKDLPDGTWFGSFYVENPKVWELIKKGEVKGFSVEGMFDYEQPTSNAEAMLAKLSEILNNIK